MMPMLRSSIYRTQDPRGRYSAYEGKKKFSAEFFFAKAEKQRPATGTNKTPK